MIDASDFFAEAGRAGFDFYTGVPCSFLTPLINGALSAPGLAYVGAASEGEAVAVAAGAWLAGRRTVVMCQNSGLGNAVNPLTSLNEPFRIPTLMITTWRGEPGIPDEPQHAVMGRITQDLLSVIGVPHAPFPAAPDALPPAFARAKETMRASGLPFAFVMRKGDVADQALGAADRPLPAPGRRADFPAGAAAEERPTRAAALERFLSLVPAEAAVIATTGKCGRELFTLADRPQHLYQVGSMGGASGMALGVALNTAAPVFVLDGDGAALMKLGTFATIGAYAPPNLVHILLDNGAHDSTGGQPTVSPGVDFAAVALACGYRYAASCGTLDGFECAFRDAAGRGAGPALIHLRIAPGSMAKLGRPTVGPAEVAQRFKAFLAGAAAASGRGEPAAASAFVTLLVGLAAVAFLIAANDPAEIFALLGAAGWGMLAVLALRPPQILFAALGWAPLIEAPRRPGWAALVRMRWIRDSVNTLLPVAQVGGEFVRVHLLIRRGFAAAPATASVAVDLATELAAQCVFAAIGVALLIRLPHQWAAAADWASAATALCGAMALGFLAAQRWGLFRLVERLAPKLTGRASGPGGSAAIAGLHEAVLRLHRAPRRFWSSGAAHLASWLLGTLEAWAALRVLGVEAGLAEALVIESLGQLARSLGFMVPGAFGIQEGGFVLACDLFGVPPEQAIAFALTRRIRDVAFAVPGLVAWRWEAMAEARAAAPGATGMAKGASPR